MKKLLLLTLMVLCYSSGYSQVPEKLSFQAVIRDASGNIRPEVNVTVGLSVLQGSSSGAAVYSESHVTSTDAFGLVRLELGGGAVESGIFSDIEWADGPFFIKVLVDGIDYGATQLLSVPYALFSARAANVFSGDWNDLEGRPALAPVAMSGLFHDLMERPTTLIGYGITDADGSVTNEIQVLSLNGSELSLSEGGGTVTLPTSGGGECLWTKSGDNIFYVEGRVGIGVTDPQAPLHVFEGMVVGPAEKKMTLFTQGIGEDIASTNTLHLNYSNNQKVSIGEGGISDLLVSGRVGIGTTSPSSRLVVAGGDATINDITVGIGSGSHQSNSVLGYGALAANTTGINNTALGNSALNQNDIGYNNTVCGFSAMSMNKSGHSNTAFGRNALWLNESGIFNTATGAESLERNDGGSDNSAHGYQALMENTSGNLNTASGALALKYNQTGDHNVADGSEALWLNSSGHNNTAVGYRSGYHSSTSFTGTKNSFLGAYTGYSDPAITNSTAIGADVILTASNTVILGNNANVGIGTSNPAYKLDIDRGNLLVRGNSGFKANGDQGILYLGSSHFRIMAEYGYGIKIGVYAKADALNVQEITGRVGIGTTTPTQALHVVGNAYKTDGGTSWASSSDLRLKNVLGDYTKGLKDILALQPVRFVYKTDNPRQLDCTSEQTGLVAQDVRHFFPEAVTEGVDGYLDFNIHSINIAMINAVKELNSKIESQQKQIDELRALVEILTSGR